MATATSVADPAWRIFKEQHLIRQEWVATWVQAGDQKRSLRDQHLPIPSSKKARQYMAINRAKGLLELVEIWCQDNRQQVIQAERKERYLVLAGDSVVRGGFLTASEAQCTAKAFERALCNGQIQHLLIKGRLYTRPHTGGLHILLRLIFHCIPEVWMSL